MKKVYKKMAEARVQMHSLPLKKSGKNSFSGYSYFELADFLPQAIKVFNDLGLFGYVSFSADTATLTIVCIEDGSSFQITSPMGSASLKGCHEVQNIGAVETYQRRYLWTTALELIENDILDKTHDVNAPANEGPSTEIQSAENVVWAINSCADMNELKGLVPVCASFPENSEDYKIVREAYGKKQAELRGEA